MSIDTSALRTFASLPDQVPEPLLTTHIGLGNRRVRDAAGITDDNTNQWQDYDDAVLLAAYISVLPFINTFALDGASQVARLVQSDVDVRFLSADDVTTLIDLLEARFRAVIRRLRSTQVGNDDGMSAGTFCMEAV